MRTPEVEPNGENATPEELRVAMEAAPNKRSYVRLSAMRALLLGYTRKQVCELNDRTDRMARLWIELFNRGGIAALITKPRPGRPRKVKLQRVRDLLVPVLEDPALAGQVHWTGVKLHGYLQEKLCVELGYRTVFRWLHELNCHLRVPQPWPERQNQEERAVFLEELHTLTTDPKVELWFSDECGVEGDPRPRRRWVQPGKPRTVPYLGTHLRQNVIGAVASQSGALFCLIVDGVVTEVFQFFLDEMAKTVPSKEGFRQVLILDNASWHRAARVNWHHFEPKFLPGYSADFNPIERLRLRLKADWFWDFIAHTSKNSPTVSPQLSSPSSTTLSKPPPSALSGNNFRHSLYISPLAKALDLGTEVIAQLTALAAECRRSDQSPSEVAASPEMIALGVMLRTTRKSLGKLKQHLNGWKRARPACAPYFSKSCGRIITSLKTYLRVRFWLSELSGEGCGGGDGRR